MGVFGPCTARNTHIHNHTPDHPCYDLAILNPPDGRNNPLWRGAISIPTKLKEQCSRHAVTTALRLATGHAFTSQYARRFRKDLPPEASACPCGWPERDDWHLIYDCPRFSHIRSHRDFYHTITSRTDITLFYNDADTAHLFVMFLEEGRVTFRPECGPTEADVPFDPG